MGHIKTTTLTKVMMITTMAIVNSEDDVIFWDVPKTFKSRSFFDESSSGLVVFWLLLGQ